MSFENLLSQNMSMMSQMHKDFMDLAKEYMKTLSPEPVSVTAEEESPVLDYPGEYEEETPLDWNSLMGMGYTVQATLVPPCYSESDINLDDPDLLGGGKSFGIPARLSIHNVDRGNGADRLLPIVNGMFSE